MPRKRSDIATRIVLAARRRFLQDGVDGASHRQIASDAKTNLGMIYYYYPTKNDLFVAVVEQIYAGLLQDITRALDTDVPLEERLRRLFGRFATLSDDEFDVIRIAIREVLISNERRHLIVELFMRGHLPMLIATLQEGIETGALRAIDHPMVPVVFVVALGILPQVARRLVMAEFAGFGPMLGADALATTAFEMFMDGIRARPVAPARAKRKRSKK
jgi:AcrR family transcriptional regulator